MVSVETSRTLRLVASAWNKAVVLGLRARYVQKLNARSLLRKVRLSKHQRSNADANLLIYKCCNSKPLPQMRFVKRIAIENSRQCTPSVKDCSLQSSLSLSEQGFCWVKTLRVTGIVSQRRQIPSTLLQLRLETTVGNYIL